MLSKERQQIKDVLDLIAEGGRFRQFDKIGSAPEPQRIANKLESYGALIGVSHGIHGKQWHITESGEVLHDFLKSGEIEDASLRRNNYILSQWALLTSVSRRKGRRDGELALLDIALGHVSSSEDYSEHARSLLLRSGSPQARETLRFLGHAEHQSSNVLRFDNHETDLKRYNFSGELNPEDRVLFERVRADMESSGEYATGQLSNKDIVLIMAMVWLQLRGSNQENESGE